MCKECLTHKPLTRTEIDDHQTYPYGVTDETLEEWYRRLAESAAGFIAEGARRGGWQNPDTRRQGGRDLLILK